MLGEDNNIPVYALLVRLVTGAVAGWFAQHMLGKISSYALMGDIVTGIIDGQLLGLLGTTGTGGILFLFLTAHLGAMLLIWVVN